jgi:predicted type IV restriction endonuclease
MPNNSLQETINNIIAKAQKKPEVYSRNETAVRDQLINPILHALGWDVTDPDIVLPNEPGKDGKVPDYSLMKNKQIKLIVEGKHLGVDLRQDRVIGQLGSYCHSRSIDFGLLTNGVEWLLFKTFERNIAERIVWHIDIRQNTEKATEKLSLLFHHNIEHLEDEIKRSKALKSYFEPITANQNAFFNWCKASAKEAFLKENKTLKFKPEEIDNYLQKKLDLLFNLAPTQSTETKPTNGVGNEIEPEPEQTTEDITTVQKQQRSGSRKLRITFADGTVFEERSGAASFVKAIEKIGIEKVMALQIAIGSSPLISTTKSPIYTQTKAGNYYVITDTDTKSKKTTLEQIANTLGITLDIQFLDK